MNVKTVGSIDRGFGEDVGDLGAVRIDRGAPHLIKGERGGGIDYREKAGIGVGHQLRLEGDCLGPGVKTVLFDLNIVVAGGEIELVVGDRHQLAVDHDSGGLGVRGDA